MLKAPAPSVTATATAPPASVPRASTVTPGSTSPVVSLTVPSTAPPWAWTSPGAASKASRMSAVRVTGRREWVSIVMRFAAARLLVSIVPGSYGTEEPVSELRLQQGYNHYVGSRWVTNPPDLFAERTWPDDAFPGTLLRVHP